MIPVSPNEKLVHEDECDGIRYFFRSFTGENEYQLFDLLSSDAKDQPIEQRRKNLDALVDFCLIGWESIDGKDIGQFPEKPSSCFKSKEKSMLIEIAFKLNRMEGEEAKN